jgi:hypothetical protein
MNLIYKLLFLAEMKKNSIAKNELVKEEKATRRTTNPSQLRTLVIK